MEVSVKKLKVLLISLGCDKNLVDSEKMLGILHEAGYELTDKEEQADVIIINSCCFINDAKEESIETILEMAQWKQKGNVKALIVAGCLAQRYQKEILAELPEVDAVVGTTGYESIVEAIEEAIAGKKPEKYRELSYLPDKSKNRIVTAGCVTSYLKIAEGCDKHCTYCIIPKIRGNYRSVPMESLVEEAQSLAAQGVRELILVAQETTLYGMDLYGKKMLPELLRELCKIQGLTWIRILYCYPEEITEELIQVIREEKKICHYLDLPIQHASDVILKRMGRRTNKQELTDIVRKLRREIPDIALRTTLISGFPGETQKQHEELKEFIQQVPFDRLGVFAYSPEENTPAAEMPDQVPEEIKQSRLQELMEVQQKIAFKRAGQMAGKELEVMIEGSLSEQNVCVARTYADAPDVDGYLFVECPYELLSGDMVKVKVIGAQGYDLIGRLVSEQEERE